MKHHLQITDDMTMIERRRIRCSKCVQVIARRYAIVEANRETLVKAPMIAAQCTPLQLIAKVSRMWH